MSRITLLGILISIGILFFAITHQTVTIEAFLNLPGLAIVLGGTAASVFVSYSFTDVIRVVRVFYVIMRKQRLELEQYVDEMTELAHYARVRGVLAMQKEIAAVSHPFLKDGLQMLVDGYTTREMRRIMEQRILNQQIREQAESRVFRTMAKFAPAFGMLGTVIGLIAMLQKMSGSSLETIGSSMAVALVTTFYGLILANMIFNPIAEKIDRRAEERVQLMSMILEGLVLIGEHWHPEKVHDALNSFLPPARRKSPYHFY